MRNVRITSYVRANFFPNVKKLKLLYGSEESGAGIGARGIALPQNTVEISC